MKISDDQIRAMFNSARDGTAHDAVLRHLCKMALNERCVADDQHPSDHRYPTPEERDQALDRLTQAWKQLHP